MMNRAKKATKRIAYALIAAAAALTAIAAAGAQTYADTGDAGVSLTVRQNVAGSPHSPDARFTYTLKPLSPDNPMPAGSAAGGYTFTIAGNRSAVIGPILFNRQDVYRYELYQTAGAAASGYTYDRRVYTIEIHIDGSLNSYLVILNGAGEKEAELIFENGYDSPDITPPAVTPPEVTPPTVAPPTAPPPEITPSVTAPPAVTPPVAPPEAASPEITPSVTVPPSVTPPTVAPPEATPPDELAPGGGTAAPGGDGPKTGDDSDNTLHLRVFIAGGLLTAGAAMYLLMGGKRGKRKGRETI